MRRRYTPEIETPADKPFSEVSSDSMANFVTGRQTVLTNWQTDSLVVQDFASVAISFSDWLLSGCAAVEATG